MAQSQAAIEAKAKGSAYFTVITTTPNNIDVDAGIFCKNLIDDAAPFNEKMYDWPRSQLEKYIYANSKNDFVYISFSYKQLGRSEAWLDSQIRALTYKGTLNLSNCGEPLKALTTNRGWRHTAGRMVVHSGMVRRLEIGQSAAKPQIFHYNSDPFNVKREISEMTKHKKHNGYFRSYADEESSTTSA